MNKYALCDDCKKPIKTIFDLHDYVDQNMTEHTVCGKCLNKWIVKVGDKEAKRLVIEKRNNPVKSLEKIKMKCPKCGYQWHNITLGEKLVKEIEDILKTTKEKMFTEDIYKSLIKRNPEWKKHDEIKLCIQFGVNRKKYSNNIHVDYVRGKLRTGKYIQRKSIYWYDEKNPVER